MIERSTVGTGPRLIVDEKGAIEMTKLIMGEALFSVDLQDLWIFHAA